MMMKERVLILHCYREPGRGGNPVGQIGKMVPESPPETSSKVGRFVPVKDIGVLPVFGRRSRVVPRRKVSRPLDGGFFIFGNLAKAGG
jgi:hypothetical protein